jgi:hypothetical protein
MINTARYDVRDYQQSLDKHPMFPARLVAKGWGHGGYSWYAVTDDGALLCAKCVRENWRQIIDATRNKLRNGWQVVGYTNSGEMDWESPEYCAHCNDRLDV